MNSTWSRKEGWNVTISFDGAAGCPDAAIRVRCRHTERERAASTGRIPGVSVILARDSGGRFNISGKGTIEIGTGQLFALEPGIAHEYIPHSRTGGELGFIGVGGESASSILLATGIVREKPCTLTGFDLIWSQMTELWKVLDQGRMSMWKASTLIYQLILDIAQSLKSVSPVSLAGEEKRDKRL